jgi:hypothetical protein
MANRVWEAGMFQGSVGIVWELSWKYRHNFWGTFHCGQLRLRINIHIYL